MIRSRRLALVAIVLAFGISACGDPSTTTPLAQQSKPKVIKLAADGQRSTAEMAPAAAAVPTGGAADSKIAYMSPTEFVYDGDLPALDGSAASWYFAPGTQPDTDRIAKLAASFGVTGDVRTVPADQGGGWAVGPADYSGPVLAVGSDGMLSWWLNGTPSAVSSGCAVGGSTAPDAGSGVAGAVPADLGTVPPDALPPVSTSVADIPVSPCEAPQPPVGVPTKEEALAKAKELFASWAYDVNSYQFDTPYADEWSASVSASLILSGMKAPITLSVGFGANGAVTYASGSLAAPQQGADYPTVGAAAGLERLKTQQNQYVGTSDTGIMKGAATEQVAPQVAPAATAVAGTAIAAPDVATPAPDIAPVCTTDMNVDCGQVSREPVTVTLNSVKRDLTMVWDADGTIWLLPAYTFGSADGGIYTVLAVADAFIQQPEPATTAPAIIPEPGVEVSTPIATSSCRVNTDPTTMPDAPLKQIAEAVVGYCVTDAQKLAESYGYSVRVAREDGVDLQVTADFSETRINVAVEKGTVTEVLSIG